MKRRQLLSLLGGGAVAWPFAARAQQAERIRRVGLLMSALESDREGQAYVGAFRAGLQTLGWAEGRNIRIEARWSAPEDAASRQRFAGELIALQPDVIFSHNTPTTASLLQQTRAIPVVFAAVGDPVGSGFVASFSRPAGNATGFATLEISLGGKWLGLLTEIAPRINRAAFLYNPPTAPFQPYLEAFKAAALSLGVEAVAAPVQDVSELDAVLAAQAAGPDAGLVVMPGPFALAHRIEITSLAARGRLPAVYPYRFFGTHGGLLCYGNDVSDNFRRAALHVHRILKGEKPGELPVEAPVKFEMVINLRTAKTLGLEVPMHLLQRADEVIE